MLDRLKQGLAMYPNAEKTPQDGLVAQMKEFYRADERWAEVVAVQGKRWGWTKVQLEIHHEGLVYPNESYTKIPRGKTLTAGDHVAIVPLKQLTKTELKSSAGLFVAPIPHNGKWADWKIHWGVEPQYGTPQPTQEEMKEQIVAPQLEAMPKPVDEVEHLRAAATLSDVEASQTTDYLEGRTSVEELHASGAMTDADYDQVQRVRQEALDRFAGLRDAGTLTQEQYQAAVDSLG